MSSLETFSLAVGQVVVLAGFFFWMSKRNTEKIDQLQIDVAVIKSNLVGCHDRHQRLIAVEKDLHAHKFCKEASYAKCTS